MIKGSAQKLGRLYYKCIIRAQFITHKVHRWNDHAFDGPNEAMRDAERWQAKEWVRGVRGAQRQWEANEARCREGGDSSDRESSGTLEMWREQRQQQQVGGTQHRGAFSTCFTTAVMWEGPGEGLLLWPTHESVSWLSGTGAGAVTLLLLTITEAGTPTEGVDSFSVWWCGSW